MFDTVRHYIIGSLKNEYFGELVLGGGIVIIMLRWGIHLNVQIKLTKSVPLLLNPTFAGVPNRETHPRYHDIYNHLL